MSNERTEKNPVAIVSLSIDRDLLNRLDDQAKLEDRTRSKMIARMIEFYLDVNQFDFYRDVEQFEAHDYNGLKAGLVKARLSSIYGEFHNKENSPEA